MERSLTSSAKRSSAVRLAVIAVVLSLGTLAITQQLKVKAELSAEEILASGKSIGYIPAEENPPLGKAIYQWDPEIEKDVPHLLGPVTGQNVEYHAQLLTRVRQTSHRNLLLDIKAGEMRYWVRR